MAFVPANLYIELIRDVKGKVREGGVFGIGRWEAENIRTPGDDLAGRILRPVVSVKYEAS